MSKMIIALALAGFTFLSAEAQDKRCVCTTSHKTTHKHAVVTPNANRNNYAQNFKVCRDNYGYHICGQTPTFTNSTRRPYYPSQYRKETELAAYYGNTHGEARELAYTPQSMIAPQGQSYPANYMNEGRGDRYEGNDNNTKSNVRVFESE